jgi:hypothetical protein
MKLLLAFVATLSLAGCELIGNVFQAGMWFGIVLVVVVIALVGWVVAKLFR